MPCNHPAGHEDAAHEDGLLEDYGAGLFLLVADVGAGLGLLFADADADADAGGLFFCFRDAGGA